MNIFAEVTIDETGIIKQIDAVKEAADRFEDEALKLRGMLAQAKATAKVSIVPLTMAGAAYLKGESEQENTDEPEQPEKETEPDTEQPDTATEPDETDTAEDETDEEGGE